MEKSTTRYEQFHRLALPARGEEGYRASAYDDAVVLARPLIQRARSLFEDPDLYPWVAAWLGLDDRFGDADEEMRDEWSLDDLPTLLREPWLSSEDALTVLETVATTTTFGAEWEIDEWVIDLGYRPTEGVVEAVVAGILLDAATPGAADKPRLTLVSKDEAEAFVLKHHSKLGWNPKGLMFTLGVVARGRLVAVSTAGHPTGKFSSRCDTRSVLELTRIASDGSTMGASSMLASRAMDLLPYSGRDGYPPLLFVTYSLLSEAGSTYASLIDKGLRPVKLNLGKAPSGARASSDLSALPQEPKMVWEFGPIAREPDWDAMVTALRFSDPRNIAALEARGKQAEADKLRSTTPEQRVAVMRRRFKEWEARQTRQARRDRGASQKSKSQATAPAWHGISQEDAKLLSDLEAYGLHEEARALREALGVSDIG